MVGMVRWRRTRHFCNTVSLLSNLMYLLDINRNCRAVLYASQFTYIWSIIGGCLVKRTTRHFRFTPSICACTVESGTFFSFFFYYFLRMSFASLNFSLVFLSWHYDNYVASKESLDICGNSGVYKVILNFSETYPRFSDFLWMFIIREEILTFVIC